MARVLESTKWRHSLENTVNRWQGDLIVLTHLSRAFSEDKPSAQNSGLWQRKHWNSFLHVWKVLELATTKTLHRRAEKRKVDSCDVTDLRRTFEALQSKLLQLGCRLSRCLGSWHQLTFVLLVLWISTLLVTDTKLMRKCKKLSQGCAQHSMLHV
jgi:hypothetical protein